MPEFEEKGATSEPPIFALDIGTHSVIGVVGENKDGVFRVWETTRAYYPKRAMRDGQIEDIEVVATTANLVRKELEQKLKISLDCVYVAAAGRSLRTQKASYEMELDQQLPIQPKQVSDLEMCAIQVAEEQLLSEQEEENNLYYVGHSVVHYYLDGYTLSDLVDHHGRKARVEIIATFLPREVLESLRTAMRKIGLRVNNVTLEPIAAMNAVIPQELRLLNLALVDIGAGTSDIAISENGSVVAYTMATIAGDEITEAIVREYLVDFEVAERMKLAASQEETKTIAYEDILGFPYEITKEQLLEKLRPAAVNLSEEICSHIMEANGKAPAAIFLVGGGSKLPGLCQLVAERLSMPENKVAVGRNNYMKKTVDSKVDLQDPEYATPMGIALTAMGMESRNGYTVTLNQREVRVGSESPVSVMSLLMMNGYTQDQLMGRSGKSVTFMLNGEKKTARGERAQPAQISINGKPASLTTLINPNDQVVFHPSQSGRDAAPVAGDFLGGQNSWSIQLNGQPYKVGTVACLNGSQGISAQHPIKDFDELVIQVLETVEDLQEQMGMEEGEFDFTVNRVPALPTTRLTPGCEVWYYPAGLRQTSPAPPEQPSASPLEREEEKKEPPLPEQPQEDGEVSPWAGKGIWVTINGKDRPLPPKPDKGVYQFLEMLNYVDIDPSKPEGNIVLKLNGRQASYLDVIGDRDAIEIYWEK